MSDFPSPTLPADLPLLALRSTIVFPGGRIAVQVAGPENHALLAAHPEDGTLVLCLLDPEEGERASAERIGVVARLLDRLPAERGAIQFTLEGSDRPQSSPCARDRGSGSRRRWRRRRAPRARPSLAR